MDVSDVLDAIRYAMSVLSAGAASIGLLYTQALRKEEMRYSTTLICIKDYASIMRDDRTGVSILSTSIIASPILAR